MKGAAESVDWSLEDRIWKRTVELYKQLRATSTLPEGWVDDNVWSQARRMATEEIANEP